MLGNYGETAMKSILLHVHDDGGLESRLTAALAVAHQQHGHLSCIQVTPVSDYVATDPFGGMYELKALFENLAERAVDVRTRVEARLTAESIEWDWSVYDEGVAASIVSRSQLTDLIVLSLAVPTSIKAVSPMPLVADVSIHSHTPVLAVPIGGKMFDPSGVAMIAWNGSPEAAHAVRAALPLLKLASAVQIISFNEDQNFPMADVRRYLDAHGVTAGCNEHRLDGKTVGEALCHLPSSLQAAYIVMGAYGHTRFREAVLGGVSRYMLAHSPLPLLLAH
jgi:nucleotide-binding universal stress UspA family protein